MIDKRIYEFVEENTNLINKIDDLIICFRKQNYNEGFELSIIIQEKLEYIIKASGLLNEIELDIIYLNNIITNIYKTQIAKDYILLADLYEIQLLPFLLRIQELVCCNLKPLNNQEKYNDSLNNLQKVNYKLYKHLIDFKKHSNKSYDVEFSSSGNITLAYHNNDKEYYLHSNYMPVREANQLAAVWFEKDKYNYSIFGLGLGYHISALLNLSEYIHIKIYESDIDIIRHALLYTDFGDKLLQNSVELIYEPNEIDLYNKFIKDSRERILLVYQPSLNNLKEKNVKENLDEFILVKSASKRHQIALGGNFRFNICDNVEPIDILSDKFRGKNLYIIAAGPSLDKNFLQLKYIDKETNIILATGTILKKLVDAGIKPDYVIGIDPTKYIYKQIEGIEDLDVPMICLSTVYKDFVSNYHGKKYIVLQNGFSKAEEYAEIHNHTLFNSGGSVSTLALDIGIQFGCKKIIFLGLDLALDNDGYNHAKDTCYIEKVNSNDLIKVAGNYEDFVPTTRNFNIYRKWIENRIKDISTIEFINATEGGAKIKGMYVKRLTDVIIKH